MFLCYTMSQKQYLGLSTQLKKKHGPLTLKVKFYVNESDPGLRWDACGKRTLSPAAPGSPFAPGSPGEPSLPSSPLGPGIPGEPASP